MIPKVGQKFMVIGKPPRFTMIETITFICIKVDDTYAYGVHGNQKFKFAFSEWAFRDPGFSYSYTFNPPPTRRSEIPPDMLKILIMLCHPDKHNNSVASTKAIKYLLEQR